MLSMTHVLVRFLRTLENLMQTLRGHPRFETARGFPAHD